QQHNQHTPDEIAEHQLNERQIIGVRNCWRADNCEGRGFCGYNGKSQCPPRRGAAAKKVFAASGLRVSRGVGLLQAPEAHPKRRHPEQVSDDNREVEGMNTHRAEIISMPGPFLALFNLCAMRIHPLYLTIVIAHLLAVTATIIRPRG